MNVVTLKKYVSIKAFLERFTILKVGKLHIRIHKILDCDRTTLLHNHPFHYISFILSGGYTEKYVVNKEVRTKTHRKWSLIIRNRKVRHRIESVKPKTRTLFIAYGKYEWDAQNMVESSEPNGVFQRIVKGKNVFSKRENGIWFIGNVDKAVAEKKRDIAYIRYK